MNEVWLKGHIFIWLYQKFLRPMKTQTFINQTSALPIGNMCSFRKVGG